MQRILGAKFPWLHRLPCAGYPCAQPFGQTVEGFMLLYIYKEK